MLPSVCPRLTFQRVSKLIFYLCNAVSVLLKYARSTFLLYVLLRCEHVTFNLMSLVVLYFEGPVNSALLGFKRRCCKHIQINTVVQSKTLRHTIHMLSPISPSENDCHVVCSNGGTADLLFPLEKLVLLIK